MIHYEEKTLLAFSQHIFLGKIFFLIQEVMIPQW